jgi:hypothetical protein
MPLRPAEAGTDIATFAHVSSEPSSALARRSLWINLLLVLPFLAFFLFQLAHHQMWRDETNPWALTLHSHSFGQLLYFIRNEAHPYLWYVLLWIVSRVATSLTALKLIAAAIVLTNYLLLAFSSPFSRLEKLLLYCGYYISFEYAVFARMYGLVLLFAFLYLRGRVSNPDKFVRNAFWLGLMANADTYGLLLTFAFVFEYVLFVRGARAQLQSPWKKRAAMAAAIYCVFVVVSMASLVPTRHVSVKLSKGGPFAHWRERLHFTEAMRATIMDTWYPVDSAAPKQYWYITHSRRVTDVFLGMVFLAAALQFRWQKRLLLMFLGYSAGIVAFMHLIYIGYSRHYGTVFIVFVAGLWIQRSEQRSARHQAGLEWTLVPPAPRFGFIPLLVSAGAGVFVAYASSTHPLSQAGAAARWLKLNQYENFPLAGSADYSAANVAAHLNRPMYFLECDCTDWFMQFSDRRDRYADKDFADRMAHAFAQGHALALIFVSTRPLTRDQQVALTRHSLGVTPLAQFTGAEEEEENFYLYRVWPVAEAPPVSPGNELQHLDPTKLPNISRGIVMPSTGS